MTALEIYFQQKADKKKPSSIQQRRMMNELAGAPEILKKHSPGLFFKLLDILDRPGNATRALLVGKLGGLKGLIPFAQTIEDLTGLDIALNLDERVTGEEVINKIFGKQRQRKGKIDPVDVLGLLVEIVADPLWLVGGAGLTKLGKAKGLVRGVIQAGDVTIIRKAIQAAKTGAPIIGIKSKKVAKAMRTVYEAGTTPKLAKTWAEQAARGERALLKLGIPGRRVPVIKGVKAWKGISKVAIKFKKSRLGEIFLAPTRRVSEKYSALHDISVRLSRDLPTKQRDILLGELHKLSKDIDKMGNLDEISAKLSDFIEKNWAGEAIERRIAKIKAERAARLVKPISQAEKKITALKKQITTRIKGLEKAGKVAEISEPIPRKITRPPKPTPPRVPTQKEIGIIPEIKGFAGKPTKPPTVRQKSLIKRRYQEQFRKTGRKAETQYQRQLAQHQEQIRKLNRQKKVLYEKQVVAEKSRARVRVKGIQSQIKSIENEVGKLERKIVRGRKLAKREDIRPIQYARGRQVKLAREAGEVFEGAPAREQLEATAAGLRGRFKGFLKAEQRVGVPVSEMDEMLGYTRRLLTPEAREFLAEQKMSARFLRQGKSLTVRTGAQRRRAKYLGHLTKDEVNEVFKTIGFEGDVFEKGILPSALARGGESFRSIGAAKTIHESVKKFSRPIKNITDVDNWINLDEFMAKTGLRVKAGEYAGRAIPKEVASALSAMQEIMSSSDAMRGFWAAFTGAQRYLKGAFTMPWPAYHGRNAISNFFLNWIAGVKNPASYALAVRLQAAAKATNRVMKKQNLVWKEAVEQTLDMWPVVKTATGEMPGHIFWDLADNYGVIGRSLGEYGAEEIVGGVAAFAKPPRRAIAKRFPRIHKHFTGQGKGWQFGRNVAGTVEDNARLAHFVEKTSQGFDPTSAARSVKKVLFDYGDLSATEKKYFRDRIFFFYTFARKNLPLQVETLIKQPAKQAFFAHLAGGTPAMGGEARFYPDWWQERLNIPIGETEEGKKRVIAGTGLPIEEAFGPLAGPGTGFVDRLRRRVSRGAARLSPATVAGAELATGHQLYFDKPIRDYGKWAIQKSPIGRLFGTVQHTRFSPDKPGSKALGFATGMRYKYYDPEKQKQYKLREIARDYLKKQTKTRLFNRYYVPKGTETTETIDLALQVQ